jgi:hypothetical protein
MGRLRLPIPSGAAWRQIRVGLARSSGSTLCKSIGEALTKPLVDRSAKHRESSNDEAVRVAYCFVICFESDNTTISRRWELRYSLGTHRTSPRFDILELKLTQSPSSTPTLGRSTVRTYIVHSSRSPELGSDKGCTVNSWARRDMQIAGESFCREYEEGCGMRELARKFSPISRPSSSSSIWTSSGSEEDNKWCPFMACGSSVGGSRVNDACDFWAYPCKTGSVMMSLYARGPGATLSWESMVYTESCRMTLWS